MTKKITRAAAHIILGKQKTLTLGNLNATRDWGYAPEYCEGMWRILQHREADDFVLATGEEHSVRDFVQASFANLGVRIAWSGSGVDEKGIVDSIEPDVMHERFGIDMVNISVGDAVVEMDPVYYRPTEVDRLVGDASKAERVLGWRAETKFSELVRIMIEADIKAAREGSSE